MVFFVISYFRDFYPKRFIGVTITYWQMRFMRFFNWLIGA